MPDKNQIGWEQEHFVSIWFFWSIFLKTWEEEGKVGKGSLFRACAFIMYKPWDGTTFSRYYQFKILWILELQQSNVMLGLWGAERS
jgi:hypothetical protein